MLEVCYSLFTKVLDSPGLSVLGLSFVVTLATLPLYMVAEGWQEEERRKEAGMAPKLERIRKAFKGDERYLVTSAYYREQHYKPVYALRSSFSLLIQIPFFIVAYTFLSHLEPLKGCSFLFIRDMGEPDGLLWGANLLPVVMTVVNCVAGWIYSKGHPVREKVQIYGCAAVFLVLLYRSPSGLVLYWTMNNVLSLVKNVFYKLRHPGKVLYLILCLFALAVVGCGIHVSLKAEYRMCIILGGILLPLCPWVWRWFSGYVERHFAALDADARMRSGLFCVGSACTALLAGLVIPSLLMQSEPELFCYVDGYASPFVFLAYPFLQSLGLFLFWPGCFYLLFSRKTKKLFAVVAVMVCALAILNTFAFDGKYGPLYPTMVFREPQDMTPPVRMILLHFVCVVAVCLAAGLLLEKKAWILRSLALVFLLAFSAVSVRNIVLIKHAYDHMEVPDYGKTPQPVFHLSKTGRNVIVLMQDACENLLIPEVFATEPSLQNQFDGFVYYPNTLSFGRLTMIGTPGIYGGYDYTPFEMNRRNTKTLQEKHNEALLTMPVLFHNAGWNVTVSDLPYENYLEEPVTDMYAGYPYVNRVTTHGVYEDYWYAHHAMHRSLYTSFLIKRNFLFFSFFKMSAPVVRKVIYDGEEYWLSYNPYGDTHSFIANYSELDLLPELTDFSCERDSLILLDNEAAHDAISLEPPAYEPTDRSSSDADDRDLTATTGIFLRLGEFFQYLKDNGVYDNTRIIIVSDHGFDFHSGKMEPERFPFRKERVLATLLVKDFNAHGAVRTDHAFMTNADTPALATEDLIENARNPFTGNQLEVKEKNDWIKIDDGPGESTRNRNHTAFTVDDDQWYTVRNDIFVDANWGMYDGPMPKDLPLPY